MCVKATGFLSRILLAGFFSAGVARADFALTAAGGGGAGQLADSESTAIIALPVSFHLDYMMSLGSVLGLVVTGSSQQWTLRYQRKGTQYAGAFTATGVGGGLILRLGTNYQLHMVGQSLSQSTMTAKSISTANINGIRFEHSTFITHTGGAGTLGRLLLVKEKTDDQFTRHERFRVGLALDVVQQAFAKKTVAVTTNDVSKSPTTSSTTDVSDQLTLGGVSLMLGLVF